MSTDRVFARDHARRIAATVRDRWENGYGPSRLEVPMGVVACLSLFTGVQHPQTLDPLRTLPDLELRDFRRDQWTRWKHAALLWPTSHPYWVCFFEWMPRSDQHRLLAGARSVAAGCLDAGLLDFIGDPRRRNRVDLLGAVLYELRKDHFGGLVDPLTARLRPNDSDRVDALRPETTLTHPVAGTGTWLLLAAQRLRTRGVDPRTVRWQAREVDELAAACLATNTVLWGLHPHVLIGSCEDDDWLEEAREVRDSALRHDCQS